jgi:hypothetical protein
VEERAQTLPGKTAVEAEETEASLASDRTSAAVPVARLTEYRDAEVNT